MVNISHSSIGQKALQLQFVREKLPELVPSFKVIQLSQFFSNWGEIQTALQKKVNLYFSSKITTKAYEQKVNALFAALVCDKKYLSKIKSELLKNNYHKVSYRTSAVLEDLASFSFAGQYKSYLDKDTTVANIVKYVTQCARSLYASNVVNYIKTNDIKIIKVDGSVIIQKMFYGTVSGVAFSENGLNEMSISYTHSWRNTTVEDSNTNQFKIDRLKVFKNFQLPVALPKIVAEIFPILMLLEKELKIPVDIEWSANGSEMKILQCRPITVRQIANTIEWDNTNISESYPGITLPLTYSFIRTLYSQVYPEFLELVGKSKKEILEKPEIFENMLGYIQGKVYYNISNWYKLVQLLPGYIYNKEFFEAMLLPAKRNTDANNNHISQNLIERIFFYKVLVQFVFLLLTTDRQAKIFSEKYQEKQSLYSTIQWQHLQTTQLLNTFEKIQKDLLKDWAVPILNDFRTMIFHGILRKFFFPDLTDYSYSSILAGLSDQTSIEPIKKLRNLLLTLEPILKNSKSKKQLIHEILNNEKFSAVKIEIRKYIDKYGGRTPDELKLENERIGEDLESFVSFLVHSVNVEANKSKKNAKKFALPIPQVIQKEKSIIKKLLLKNLFSFVLSRCKRAISTRERFRFYRAQVFGIARKAYIALGIALVEQGVIRNKNDIFYLTHEELKAFIYSHHSDFLISEIIDARKKRFTFFEKQKAERRITGNGILPGLSIHSDKTNKKNVSSLTGLGVAQGITQGKVQIVKNFSNNLQLKDKILVAPHTDPGWTLLFVQAAGVIVERGNALSHASIVAREMGIPAIVAVEDACQILKNGQRVQINGNTGEITIL